MGGGAPEGELTRVILARVQRLLVPILAAFLTVPLGCDEPEESPPDAGVDAGGTGQAPCPRDGGPVDANVATGLTNTCAEGLVFSGFGLRWDDGAHRLARFGVFPRIGAEHFPDGCPESSALRGAALVTALSGGPETRGAGAPGGEVLATYHVVGAGGGGPLPALDGGAWTGLRIARGQVTIDLDGAEGSAPELFDLALAGMAGAPAIAVVLDGIELTTDVAQRTEYPRDYDPRDGYSTRGIGASIGNVRREGDTLRFDAGARFELGTRDRPEMNRAIRVARTRMIVHYAVVALASEPARASIDYREQHRGHGEAELTVCRPAPSTTELTIEGAPLSRAAPALASFSLRLFPDAEDEGDDVRELSMRIGHFAYDAGSGRATMRVEGYASNEGPPPPARPMDYEVEAEVVLLQWDGTDEVEELALVAPIEAGRSELPLPLTER